MASEPKHAYGLSTNLFVSRKASGDAIIVGGVAQDSSRFARVLAQGAARTLWFHLTQLLFPERADMVTAIVMTAPLRSRDLPTVTTHVTVERIDDPAGFEIVGEVGDQTWSLRLNDYEAQRFWTALDIALHPVGWQGGTPDNNASKSD